MGVFDVNRDLIPTAAQSYRGRDRAARSHFVHYLWALPAVTAALIGGNEVLKTSRSPGDAIRRELVAAAAELLQQTRS
jgi:hypothetical protein